MFFFLTDRGDANQRLDRAITRRLLHRPDLSRTRIQRLIANGQVVVDGAPATRASMRPAAGVCVEVVVPSERPRRPLVRQPIPLRVLYEDNYMLAVDKPAGMVVHPTKGHAADTLANALAWLASSWPDSGGRPGLVHRLDRDTTGVVLVAKSALVHARLARAMSKGAIRKEYLAVVHGRPTVVKGEITLRLARSAAGGSRMVATRGEGLASTTRFEEMAAFAGSGVVLSVLRCTLVTGRTHQIRAHLAGSRLPIVGDPLYGAPRHVRAADPALRALLCGFCRQALHARRVVLGHPITGARLEIVAPLPVDLEALVSAVPWEWSRLAGPL